ncbi:helix-turn-helix transcriptional regulator [Clostridiales bacterium]|nr:helix-turn-helix transcriptional regulator [Clostridiales bacterium]
MNGIRINEQIAFLRREKGITQETLAKHLNVTNQTVSKWESGQCYPDIQLLPEIADFFGISVDELLGHAANSGLESLCLALKNHFTALPAEECFDHAYRLAAQLHEAVMTGGYKQSVPWEEKDYAKEPAARWGLSAWNEAEGSSVRCGDTVLFTGSRAWSRMKKSDIRNVARELETLSDEDALKALFALQDLTVNDPDRYVSAAEIAEKARMTPEAVERILGDLPLAVREDGDGEQFRISGAAAWLPSVLALLRGPLPEDIENS